MSIKTTINYSPNFYPKKRAKKEIIYLVIHYTGMKNEKAALNRLTKIQSQVSSHYLIKKDGDIILLVPDLYIAWHAGFSSWKKKRFLNTSSIGIELTNPGHEFNYKKFSKKQINSLIKLSKFLIKKYKINRKNILGHSDISPERKKDPGEKFPWEYLSKNKIGVWHKINKNILKKMRNNKISKIEEAKFFQFLNKIGYFVKTHQSSNKTKLIKSFQRHFRQSLINGKIDQECLFIAKKLSKLS